MQPMKTQTIETVERGDFFRLPGKKVVYVKDEYNRHTKKYSSHKFDDISAFREFKKGTLVETGFEF